MAETSQIKDIDTVWKALADPTRREILEILRSGSRGTTMIVEEFRDASRFAIMKHLDVLRAASLVVTEKDGRKKINSLNLEPIEAVIEQWLIDFKGEPADDVPEIALDRREAPKRVSERRKKPDFGWTKYDLQQ